MIKPDRLEPCPNPWCESHSYEDGGPKVPDDLWGCSGSNNLRVGCHYCDMKGPPRSSEAEAISAWNTRPIETNSRTGDVVGEAGAARHNPCDGIFDHKWLSPSCVAEGCRSLNTRRLLDEIKVMEHEFTEHTNSWLSGFARARKMAVDLVRAMLDPAVAEAPAPQSITPPEVGQDPYSIGAADACEPISSATAKTVATSREIMLAGGVDPDAPFEVGPFPSEMRQTPDRIEALRAALREMVYETTHLSPVRSDGSHECRISAMALANARAAIAAPEVGGELVEELQHKLRCVISHATGGLSSDIDQSLNDICVSISAFRNRIWKDAQAAAIATLSTPEVVDGTAGLVDALERCAKIVERNLYRQHEKIEDVPKIARAALSQHRGDK